MRIHGSRSKLKPHALACCALAFAMTLVGAPLSMRSGCIAGIDGHIEQAHAAMQPPTDAGPSDAAGADGASSIQDGTTVETTTTPEGTTTTTTHTVILPSSYYLMNHGLSTPAKLQSPWGDCWAFAVASALESSILKKQGQIVESLPVGGTATSATAAQIETNPEPDAVPLFNSASEEIDLSERAIAWFSHELQTEASAGSQAGEGYYLMDPTNPLLQLAEGNFAKVTSLLASGQAIVAETTVPYAYNGYDADPYWYSTGSYNGAPNDARTRDWSVPDNLRYDATVGWVVTDVKKLSCPAITSTDPQTGYASYEGYDPKGTSAIKEAIYTTGAVAVALSSDTSVPSEITSGNFAGASPSEHFTYSTWCQYDSSALMSYNHAVSIVGWDDSFSATNFAGTASGMPTGNGAWLCKNNWGSDVVYATGGSANDALHWGLIDENGSSSGYFWLSYYDHTIHDPVSFEVAPVDEGFDTTYQYDYLGSAEFTNPATYQGEVWTANIFEASSPELLKAVSCETFKPDDKVEIEVYKLPNARSSQDLEPEEPTVVIDTTEEMLPVARALSMPTSDSTVANDPPSQISESDATGSSPLDGLVPFVTLEQTFKNAGFHTVDLEKPILFTEGERFAVAVQVIAAADGSQSSAPGTPDADAASDDDVPDTTYLALELAYLNALEGSLQSTMATVVVHEGESYVSLSPGYWMDVVDFNESRSHTNANPANARTYGNALAKAYSNDTSMVKAGQVYKTLELEPITVSTDSNR